MELIERYIYEVTHRLPVDMQADIEDELRNNINETLEEKDSHSKQAVKEVLVSLGDPALLAHTYSSTTPYLIGPKIFWLYTRALKLTFQIGIPIILTVAVISQIVSDPTSIGGFISGVIGIVIGATIQILFWTTLVFFILERTGLDAKELNKNSTWDPSMLPLNTKKRGIPISESISEIIWFSFIILLPFIAQPLIGVHMEGTTTPIFNPEIGNQITPIILVIGLAGLTIALAKMKVGHWTKKLATINAAYALLFSASLIVAPLIVDLINPAFVSLLDHHIDTAKLSQISQVVQSTLWISIAITVLVTGYEAIAALYRAYRR